MKQVKCYYEEFAYRLMQNEELDFVCKGIEYSIVHNPPFVYLGINVLFENGEYKSERVEEYSSVVELLNQFKIDGKKIRDLWDDNAYVIE